MNKKQKQNAFIVLDALKKSSIISDAMRIGILCVLMKESGLIPRREKSYANTSNERIRKKFGIKKLREYYDDDDALTRLKRNPEAFFSHVYAYLYGNGDPESGDGWRTRGGGLNQLTFSDNYRLYQKLTGWALVKKPGMIRYIECAAPVAVAFFEQSTRYLKKDILDYLNSNFGAIDVSKAGVMLAAWINAGLGKKPESAAVQLAYKNALEHLPEMQKIYDEWSKSNAQETHKAGR